MVCFRILKLLAFYDIMQCRLVHRVIQEERKICGMKNVLQFKIIFVNPTVNPHPHPSTPPPCALQLVREGCVLSESNSMFLDADSSIQNARERFVLCIHFLLLTSLFIQSHKQKSNGVTYGDLGGQRMGPQRQIER
jgi:hypothetical protein